MLPPLGPRGEGLAAELAGTANQRLRAAPGPETDFRHGLLAAPRALEVILNIGDLPIGLRTSDSCFTGMLQERYAGFLTPGALPAVEFDVELVSPEAASLDDDLRVTTAAGRWWLERGDFWAEFDPAARRGRIRQSANPYSIDSVLRIVHTLMLAGTGGFLLHAASGSRNGRAFLFAGPSGAGKTTIASLAPTDVTLFTDEVSYVRKRPEGYWCYGTPFTGELAKPGVNASAPVAALYLLAKGDANRLEPVGPAEAARRLLEDILFFARERGPVGQLFQAACDFVTQVPTYRLTFAPDARVWEMVV